MCIGIFKNEIEHLAKNLGNCWSDVFGASIYAIHILCHICSCASLGSYREGFWHLSHFQVSHK